MPKLPPQIVKGMGGIILVQLKIMSPQNPEDVTIWRCAQLCIILFWTFGVIHDNLSTMTTLFFYVYTAPNQTSDFRHIKWAARLVIANGHLIFLRCLRGYVWVDILTFWHTPSPLPKGWCQMDRHHKPWETLPWLREIHMECPYSDKRPLTSHHPSRKANESLLSSWVEQLSPGVSESRGNLYASSVLAKIVYKFLNACVEILKHVQW